MRLRARPDGSTPPNSVARQSMLGAFAKLALSRRYREFGVEAVIRSAKVARSTFYYHFSSKDDLLLENLQPFIAALADMPLASRPSDELHYWVAHIWQHRAVARRLLEGGTGRKIEAALVKGLNDAFAARCSSSGGAYPLLARQIAGGSLSLLKAWVGHNVTGTPIEIAHVLWQCAISISTGALERQ